jgi:hypothetical protein
MPKWSDRVKFALANFVLDRGIRMVVTANVVGFVGSHLKIRFKKMIDASRVASMWRRKCVAQEPEREIIGVESQDSRNNFDILRGERH